MLQNTENNTRYVYDSKLWVGAGWLRSSSKISLYRELIQHMPPSSWRSTGHLHWEHFAQRAHLATTDDGMECVMVSSMYLLSPCDVCHRVGMSCDHSCGSELCWYGGISGVMAMKVWCWLLCDFNPCFLTELRQTALWDKVSRELLYGTKN